MKSFYEWLKEYANQEDQERVVCWFSGLRFYISDLLIDVEEDLDFPKKSTNLTELLRHLHKMNASTIAIETLVVAFYLYSDEMRFEEEIPND